MKRAAIYLRVSTLDQNPQTQVHDLRSMATQRNLEIVKEYIDHGISGTRARRPGLDELMRDARHGCFDVVLVWASDRLARSVAPLPGNTRRTQPLERRVRQFPRTDRHGRPAGPRRRHHHRRGRRTGAQPNRRACSSWYAPGQAGRSPHRPSSCGDRPRCPATRSREGSLTAPVGRGSSHIACYRVAGSPPASRNGELMDREELRRRACAGKVPYASKADAEAAVERWPPRRQGRLSTYKCQFCSLWHWGHRDGKRRKTSP